MVTPAPVKTYSRDSDILRAAKAFGLVGNPLGGRAPVVIGEEPHTHRNRALVPLFSKSFPAWNRCGPMLKAVYETLVLSTRDDGTAPWALNLRLSGRRKSEANRFSRGPLEHLRREIKRKLERAFDRPVEFWLAAEFGGAKKGHKLGLHFHGAFAFHRHELRRARAILKQIVGGEPRAVAFRHINDPRTWKSRSLESDVVAERTRRNPAGWGRYVFKNLAATSFFVRGSVFTDTTELNRDARSMWEYHRSLLTETVRNR